MLVLLPLGFELRSVFFMISDAHGLQCIAFPGKSVQLTPLILEECPGSAGSVVKYSCL